MNNTEPALAIKGIEQQDYLIIKGPWWDYLSRNSSIGNGIIESILHNWISIFAHFCIGTE
jgi:hypothetical protein